MIQQRHSTLAPHAREPFSIIGRLGGLLIRDATELTSGKMGQMHKIAFP